MDNSEKLQEARMRLVETGGRVSQDFGTGRIVGQVLVYLYLQDSERSLDDIEKALGLSKASVSISVRQLDQLGLTRKVWKVGDKRNYYKSAENIGEALQQGILSLVHQKIRLFGGELEGCLRLINDVPQNDPGKDELVFLRKRIKRAQKLQIALERILGSPLVKLITKITNLK